MAILDAARTAAAELAGRGDEIEATRRLPADIAQGLARKGLLRMLVPHALGGLECPPADALHAMEIVAEADAATGWCTMIAATSGVTMAYLPQVEAQAIFAKPDTILGGVFAPMGKAVAEGDHYRVSGRWQWGSGSANCDWLMGGCVIMRNGEIERLPNGAPASRMMLFPASDVTLHDTWYAVGMSGTGSGDMEVSDCLVPQGRSVSLMTDRPAVPGSLYAFPVFGLLALGIASVALGNARGAMNALKDLAQAKRRQGSTRTIAETTYGQSRMAEAEASWRGARAFLHDAVATAWAEAQEGGVISVESRAQLRLAAVHATRASAEVARSMYDLGGGVSVFLSSELQRRFRDAHVATQHMMVAPSTYEVTGRVLFGLETDTTFL